MNKEKPYYVHNCKRCIFVGRDHARSDLENEMAAVVSVETYEQRVAFKHRVVDMYVCDDLLSKKLKYQMLIRRYGNLDNEFELMRSDHVPGMMHKDGGYVRWNCVIQAYNRWEWNNIRGVQYDVYTQYTDNAEPILSLELIEKYKREVVVDESQLSKAFVRLRDATLGSHRGVVIFDKNKSGV